MVLTNPPHSLKIALIGIGKVAQSRTQAISEMSCFELAGLVSRRTGVGNKTFEEVLNDSSISAIAISTENTNHVISVRKALEANKHVLCDYPLALSSQEAADLFQLAKERKKILQVEHIALLTEAHQQFKKNISSLGKLIHGKFDFQAGWNSSLADISRQGPFPFLAESRLVQLADLFGDFEVVNSHWYSNEKEAEVQLLLRFEKGGEISFSEKRGENLRRERFFTAKFEKGETSWPVLKEVKGLFKKDLEIFYERISKNCSSYYDEKLMIEVLKKIEKIIQSRC